MSTVKSAAGVLMMLVICSAWPFAMPARSGAPRIPIFTNLASFTMPAASSPYAGVVQATDGNFYGTTEFGGILDEKPCDYFGCGTIFKITPAGDLSSFYQFCSNFQNDNCTDGFFPFAGLVQGTDGSLYGAADLGGNFNGGTIFRITLGGKLATLYNFCSSEGCSDGSNPVAAPIQGTYGDFYGTTEYGGGVDNCGSENGCGTVFRITPQGVLTTLHRFSASDGGWPLASLVQGRGDVFYGTTSRGGANDDGTVFSITSGGRFTSVYSFCSAENCSDGKMPDAGLVYGLDGYFYGTTTAGGSNGMGTVFRINPQGVLTTLHSFCSASGCSDGADPAASLVRGTDGNFYGTTSKGGVHGEGTAFAMSPLGKLVTLYNFCSESECLDGSFPPAGLFQGTDGAFYGTASSGGSQGGACAGIGCGTVFSLTGGLPPFVTTNPAAAKIGATVGILGTDLTGASNVSFNGIATAFRVVSKTFIEAKVPSGATTGKIQVTTPGGILNSNIPFVVIK